MFSFGVLIKIFKLTKFKTTVILHECYFLKKRAVQKMFNLMYIYKVKSETISCDTSDYFNTEMQLHLYGSSATK